MTRCPAPPIDRIECRQAIRRNTYAECRVVLATMQAEADHGSEAWSTLKEVMRRIVGRCEA